MENTLSLPQSQAPQQQRERLGFSAHLEFFDRNGDQEISLQETLLGLERIGLGHLIAVPATAVIHLGLAGLGVVRGKLQNPLRLSLPSVGVLRHPDTALIDQHAELDLAQLDEMFAKYARKYPGEALTLTEILVMTSARLRDKTRGFSELLLLPSGAVGTFVEWVALLWLAGELRDGQHVLTKSEAFRFYKDPQFFHDVASRLKELRKLRATSVQGNVRNFVQSWLL